MKDMTVKQKVGCLSWVFSIFLTYPIWYYLLYQILQYVQATDLMWFLYWIYVPAGMFWGIIQGVVSAMFSE